MYCENCGARLQEDQSFCSACGKPVVAASPAVAYRGKVARHVQLVAILLLVWSLLRLVGGAGFLFFGGFWLHFIPFPGRVWLLPYAAFGIISVGYAACGVIAAWGLFRRFQWARVLTLVVACLSLISIPFGTALGIYILWVFLPEQSGEEYRRMSHPR